MFEQLVNAGLDVLQFLEHGAEKLFNMFFTEIGTLVPILDGTSIEDLSIFSLMFTSGITIYITKTLIRYSTDWFD